MREGHKSRQRWCQRFKVILQSGNQHTKPHRGTGRRRERHTETEGDGGRAETRERPRATGTRGWGAERRRDVGGKRETEVPRDRLKWGGGQGAGERLREKGRDREQV